MMLPPIAPGVLSTSLVTYHSPPELLQRTLVSYGAAIAPLVDSGWRCELTVVDNGNTAELVEEALTAAGLSGQAIVIANQHNLGFGGAHNQALQGARSDIHLILNPDVEMAADALAEALRYLAEHPEAVAISPACRSAEGHVDYLCKQPPSVLDLALRGFAPAWLRRCFARRLSRYRCEALIAPRKPVAVPLISGCWMLCRTAALQAVGGFDARYFLYFEDFALSHSLSRHGQLVHLPAARIVHHGGNAARKGWRHRGYFIRSALRYFQQFGWRWW